MHGQSAAQCQQWKAGFHLPGTDEVVLALTTFDDGAGNRLYAGGGFRTAGGASASGVAKWDGATWSPLDAGIDQTVFSLAGFDDGTGPALYAGGSFTIAGGVPANHIARWNGAIWSQPGSGTNGDVLAIAVFDDGSGSALYAGGAFSTAGGVGATNLARWDGAGWTPVGGGANGAVRALAAVDFGSGPRLIAAGAFTSAGGASANRIAVWDGSAWSSLGSGMDGTVVSLGVFDDGGGGALYAGGEFTIAGGTPASRVAKWDGASWFALGSGLGGAPTPAVNALLRFDDGSGAALYAGGNFTTAGGASASHIARWNGSSWTAVAAGVDTQVNALAVVVAAPRLELWAGGNFSRAGSSAAAHVARWDGTSWSASPGAGASVPDYVNAVPFPETFLVHDDGTGPALYVGGGALTYLGSAISNGIGRWDGTIWTPLGGGLGQLGGSPTAYALASFDDGTGPGLFVGGYFLASSGAPANFIAKWNGASWSPLGSGTNGTGVYALTVFDDGSGPALYAGGGFQSAGGMSANNVARWNGSSWSPLGSGTNQSVYALAVYDDGTGPALYAGGIFWLAGGAPADRIAKWNGTSWLPLGTGTGSSVWALAVYDDGSGPALYAGGSFTGPGNHVAKWDGSTWSQLGPGTNGYGVNALAVFDDGSGPGLYAGGRFTAAGGVPASNVARWDGTSWSALGGGPSVPSHARVGALGVFDDGAGGGADLYVGGVFTNVDGVLSSGIAEWQGCGPPGVPFCFGDGSGAACPCANSGLTGHGCENSASTGGALLASSGRASLSGDTLVLDASGELPAALGIFLQGDAQIAPAPFGDGLRCAGGALLRLYTQSANGGAASAPGTGDPSVSARAAALGDTITAGAKRYYMAYYRDPFPFCLPPAGSTWNATNGLRVTWSP